MDGWINPLRLFSIFGILIAYYSVSIDCSVDSIGGLFSIGGLLCRFYLEYMGYLGSKDYLVPTGYHLVTQWMLFSTFGLQ